MRAESPKHPLGGCHGNGGGFCDHEITDTKGSTLRDIWIVLDLNPEPWAIGPVAVARGAKGVHGHVGRNKQVHAFEEAVKEQVKEKLGWKDGDPVIFTSKVKLTLFLWRNRAEYASPQARTARNKEADATNMLKSTEDALQGIVYKNDKDNRDVRSVIVDQSTDSVSRIVIHVEEWCGLDPEEIPSSIWDRIDNQPQMF